MKHCLELEDNFFLFVLFNLRDRSIHWGDIMTETGRFTVWFHWSVSVIWTYPHLPGQQTSPGEQNSADRHVT